MTFGAPIPWRRRSTTASRIAFLGLLLAAGVFPGSVRAQDAEPLDHERLTQFARAHLAINDARDEFHGQMARVHDEEGRLRAREEADARIEEVLEEQEMTREEYDAFILRISIDGELRTAFEEIVASIEGDASEGG